MWQWSTYYAGSSSFCREIAHIRVKFCADGWLYLELHLHCIYKNKEKFMKTCVLINVWETDSHSMNIQPVWNIYINMGEQIIISMQWITYIKPNVTWSGEARGIMGRQKWEIVIRSFPNIFYFIFKYLIEVNCSK